MTDKKKIRNIIELFIAWNGETEAIDVANLDSAVDFIADSLQEEPVWKPANGDDLPEIDREVIALLNNGKVVFAHRPYKGKYIGKNLTTGNIETFENKTYDKGGWNQPYVKWWLDVELPKEK